MRIVGAGFLAAASTLEGADVVLLGAPFDGTSTFRPGSRFGPAALRGWSQVLETYSPGLGLDLEDLRLADAGDLEVPVADWGRTADAVRSGVAQVVAGGAVPVVLGGEHLVTLPAVEAVLDRHPDLAVIHLDAHLDLRDAYQGERHSHATVMRRVLELVGPGRLHQWGQRSGPREEWELAGRAGTLVQGPAELRSRVGDRPVYLSLDLDVLDPSAMPDTGTPEPGGITFRQLEEALAVLKGLPIVGADVVEYCPASGSAAAGAAAAKAVREVVLLCGAAPRPKGSGAR